MEYRAPGVYVEEVLSPDQPIEGASVSVAGFIGVTRSGPLNQALLITSIAQFRRIFGRPYPARQLFYLGYAVERFFHEGGTRCYVVRIVSNASAPEVASAIILDEILGPNAITINASSPGLWGRNIVAQTQNTTDFTTRLSTDFPAAATPNITLESTEGLGRGDQLWIINPIIGTVTYGIGGALELLDGLIFDADRSTVPAGDILAGAQVVTPDLRYMGRLNSNMTVTLGTNSTPDLATNMVNVSNILNDVNDVPLPEGETLWVIPAANAQLATVARVESEPNNIVHFPANITPASALLTGTRVIRRGFKLSIEHGEITEIFEHLTLEPTDLRNFVPNRVNSGRNRSGFVRVVANVAVDSPVNARTIPLTGTSTDADGIANLAPLDYIGNAATGTGISAFDGIDDVSTLAVPAPRFTDVTVVTNNGYRQVYNALTAYCERRRYLFCLIDSPAGLNNTEILQYRQGPGAPALNASNYGALYWPWLQIVPEGSRQMVSIPPSGAIAGVYARHDAHIAPAGTEAGRLRSIKGIERLVPKAEQDGLNRHGVNVIRSFRTTGLNVWGTRTISAIPEWRYISVRRLISYIGKSIDDATQWVVFEPNNTDLWAAIERNISGFLRTVWRSGALFGATEAQAFRVKCDAETNSSTTIELGQIITEIKVAPVKPAEFVIFRIKQTAAGAEIEE